MPKLDLSDPLSVMDIVFAITNDYGTTTYHRPSAVIKNDKTGMWSVEFSDNEVLTADTNRWPANNQHRPANWVLHSGHWWPINCPDRFPGVLEGEILAEYVERVIYDAPKADELSEEDKLTVARARKIQRFLSQPFFVAEVFTGSPGKLVDLDDTIKGFDAICKGEYDNLPEAAFYMVGGIEEVIEKAEKLSKDSK